jgi:ubiquinone biosynthesis protein UbiJ
LIETARRMRAAARGRKPNVNYALARLIGEVQGERLGEGSRRSDIQESVQESERKERDNELRYT